MSRDQQFDEIQVFEGVAERTGTTVDRGVVRRNPRVCRSVAELTQKARRMGDGFFYMASARWPEGTPSLVLHQTWAGMSVS